MKPCTSLTLLVLGIAVFALLALRPTRLPPGAPPEEPAPLQLPATDAAPGRFPPARESTTRGAPAPRPRGALAGSVRSEWGVPLPSGATVRLLLLPAGAVPAPGIARPAGREVARLGLEAGAADFTLADLEPGRYLAVVEAPGRVAVLRPVTIEGDTVSHGADFVLRGAGGISGTAVHAETGAPVAGARVLACLREGASSPIRTETDEEGRFSVNGLGPGTFGLRIEAGGLLAVEVAGVVVDPYRETAGLLLRLEPGCTLSGTVHDDRGRPVAGAQVWAQSQPAAGETAIRRAGTTDGDGRFRLPQLAAGRYRVLASRGGELRMRGRDVTIPAPRGEQSCSLKLETTLLVRFAAVTGSGAPASGVSLGFSGEDDLAGAALADAKGEAEARLLPGPYRVTISGRDGTGRFVSLGQETVYMRSKGQRMTLRLD